MCIVAFNYITSTEEILSLYSDELKDQILQVQVLSF